MSLWDRLLGSQRSARDFARRTIDRLNTHLNICGAGRTHLINFGHLEVSTAGMTKHIILIGEYHGHDEVLWATIENIIRDAESGTTEGRVDFFIEERHAVYAHFGWYDTQVPAPERRGIPQSLGLPTELVDRVMAAGKHASVRVPDFDADSCLTQSQVSTIILSQAGMLRMQDRSQKAALSLPSQARLSSDLAAFSDDFRSGYLSAGTSSSSVQGDVELQRRGLVQYLSSMSVVPEYTMQRLNLLAATRWKTNDKLHFHAFDTRLAVRESVAQDYSFRASQVGATGYAEYLIGRQLGKSPIARDAIPVLAAVLRCVAELSPETEADAYFDAMVTLPDLYCITRMFKAANYSSPVAIVYAGGQHTYDILQMLRAMFGRSDRFQLREHFWRSTLACRALPWESSVLG